MTTIASGRWISLPGPLANSSGTRPSAVMLAVISTGRRRRMAPSRTACARLAPAARNWLKKATITSPLRTAMPSSAMKPTAAGTDKYSPDSHSAITPPTSANGMLARISSAGRTAPKVLNRVRKIAPSAIGTTSASRAAARCWFSNWPPQTRR